MFTANVKGTITPCSVDLNNGQLYTANSKATITPFSVDLNNGQLRNSSEVS